MASGCGLLNVHITVQHWLVSCAGQTAASYYQIVELSLASHNSAIPPPLPDYLGNTHLPTGGRSSKHTALPHGCVSARANGVCIPVDNKQHL